MTAVDRKTNITGFIMKGRKKKQLKSCNIFRLKIKQTYGKTSGNDEQQKEHM